jgi:transposase
MVAYALRYGEQEIPYRSVRRQMALHRRPPSAWPHRTRAPQAARLTSDTRRRLLHSKEWLSLAVAAEGLRAPWKTVYDWFRRWRIDGTWERLNTELRQRLRWRLGRDPHPSAGIVDSQSARTTGVGGNERGFDPAKKVEGRKRHLLVDSEGLVIEARVHSTKVLDEDGIRLLCWSRRAIVLGAFLIYGSMPDTRGGAGGGPRRY